MVLNFPGCISTALAGFPVLRNTSLKSALIFVESTDFHHILIFLPDPLCQSAKSLSNLFYPCSHLPHANAKAEAQDRFPNAQTHLPQVRQGGSCHLATWHQNQPFKSSSARTFITKNNKNGTVCILCTLTTFQHRSHPQRNSAATLFPTLDFGDMKAQGVSCLVLLYFQFCPLSEVWRLSVSRLMQSNLSFDHKPQI